MNFAHKPDITFRTAMNEPAMLSEVAFEVTPTLDFDGAMDADPVFDEGVLAVVPYAFDAYMNHQCFGQL